jgi:hypothetical protein
MDMGRMNVSELPAIMQPQNRLHNLFFARSTRNLTHPSSVLHHDDFATAAAFLFVSQPIRIAGQAGDVHRR